MLGGGRSCCCGVLLGVSVGWVQQQQQQQLEQHEQFERQQQQQLEQQQQQRRERLRVVDEHIMGVVDDGRRASVSLALSAAGHARRISRHWACGW